MDAFINGRFQPILRQLPQIINRPIHRFNPRFPPPHVIIEAGILIVKLKFLQLRGEVLVRSRKRLAHLIGNGAQHAHFGVFGAVENVMFRRLILTGRLQHHLHNVLNPFHSGEIVFSSDHVDDAVGNFAGGRMWLRWQAGVTF